MRGALTVLSVLLVAACVGLFVGAALDFDPMPPETPDVVVCIRRDALAGTGRNRVEFRVVDAEARVLPFLGVHIRGTTTKGVRFQVVEGPWSCGPVNQ